MGFFQLQATNKICFTQVLKHLVWPRFVREARLDVLLQSRLTWIFLQCYNVKVKVLKLVKYSFAVLSFISNENPSKNLNIYIMKGKLTHICPLLNILYGVTNGTMLHWRKRSQPLSRYFQSTHKPRKITSQNSESMLPVYIWLSYPSKGNIWLLQCSHYIEAAVIY